MMKVELRSLDEHGFKLGEIRSYGSEHPEVRNFVFLIFSIKNLVMECDHQ